jgi:hypothetical protein
MLMLTRPPTEIFETPASTCGSTVTLGSSEERGGAGLESFAERRPVARGFIIVPNNTYLRREQGVTGIKAHVKTTAVYKQTMRNKGEKLLPLTVRREKMQCLCVRRTKCVANPLAGQAPGARPTSGRGADT